VTEKTASPTPQRWSQKTSLLALLAALTMVVMSTCSYLAWNMYWSPEALARKARAKKGTKPRWAELSATQREALAPLAGEWNRISSSGKKTWLVIGDRIALMSPDEKERAQQRLRDWVKLTPEQRKLVRANYALAKKKLPPNEKMAQWQNYQQLTDEQRKELAATAPAKNQAAVTAAPSVKEEKVAHSVDPSSNDAPQKSAPPASIEQPPPATAPTPATQEAAPV